MTMDFRPVIVVALFVGAVIGSVATLIAGVVIDHVSVAIR